MSYEEIVLKRLKETLDVLKGKNVIGRLDFQIRNMVEDCLRVIEKQQKEIELLKEENEKYKNPPFFDKDKYTENDKIKAKIEELEKELEDIELKNINKDEISKTTFYFIDRLKCKIKVLQSLLEKE